MSVDLTSQKRASYPLLATRFFLPPLPLASVLRPRLMERMKQALQTPLTLISAPPGFGKSSLTSQWIYDQAHLKAGWLSLEPADQDWRLFFRYLVAAWQHVFPQVGETALAELNTSPSIRRETLLGLLLNDLLANQERAGTDHALLVLDDFHHIESADIHDAILYFVEHLPPHCHMIILTRADPPLPVARWRSRGLVFELRADDLRFTPAETVEYLNQRLHLGLAEAQIGILLERTEGWIAGLQMAALSLQRGKDAGGRDAGGRDAGGKDAVGKDAEAFVRDFDGSNRFVLDYLAEEVMNCQSEAVQQFLITTTLLEQFCGPVCDALLGTSSPYAQRMLERLEKANLFLIPLDDRRCWFRYHHLFADLLRMRLQQTHPEQIPVIYRRAAEWFAENGLWRDAIRYALQAKDMDYSAALLEQAILKGGLNFLYSGMRELIEPFPAAVVQTRPLLCLAKAVAIYESSRLEGIEPLLRFAEKGILASPPFPGQEEVLGWIYVIQSNVATLLGNHTWMIEAGQQMPKWIPNDFVTNTEALLQLGNSAYYEGNFNQTDTCWQQALDLSLASNNTYYILGILNGLARLCCQKGELNRADVLFQRSFDLLEAHCGQYPIWLGAMQRDYSDLLRERNRLVEARALIVTALPLIEKWYTISALEWGFITGARVLLASGDLPGAHSMLNKADELRRRYTLYPDLEAQAQITRTRVCLEEGNTELAWQMLETCLQSDCCQYDFHREWVLMAQARVLVRTGRPTEALTLLADRMVRAKANGRGRNWLTMCLITALAHSALGERQTAFQRLGDGLVFAQAQGFRRIFIEEGKWMRELLEAYRVEFPQAPLADEIADIISIFPVQPADETAPLGKGEGLYESLSRRELEILRLVCQGLSNQEIAKQLVLTVGTVKSHIHHIFGKLGVRDRPQAIAKANQLKLG